MIDFQNASYLKLRPADNAAFANFLTPMLANGEGILATFQGIRDGVVFTNKRIFAINVQGVTGKKKDFTSLPYSKIQAFPPKPCYNSIGTHSKTEGWIQHETHHKKTAGLLALPLAALWGRDAERPCGGTEAGERDDFLHL